MPKRKNYVQIPTRAFYSSLTPIQFRILAQLCQLDFRFHSTQNPDAPFFYTDRDLAQRCLCSTRSVWTAKKVLAHHLLIEYSEEKHRTYYRILYREPLGDHSPPPQ